MATKLRVEKVRAKRIALISDTHFMKPKGADVPRPLLRALRGADLILHLGHISSPASLDKLERVAHVLAVQTPLDDRLMGDGLAKEMKSGRTRGYARVLECGGVRIGMIHNLATGSPKVAVPNNERIKLPTKPMSEVLRSRFGQRVDVVAFANTHAPIVAWRDGVLFVNPGSPNLPAHGKQAAIAILEIERGTAHVEIVELKRR